jgi:hypothetical protein
VVSLRKCGVLSSAINVNANISDDKTNVGLSSLFGLRNEIVYKRVRVRVRATWEARVTLIPLRQCLYFEVRGQKHYTGFDVWTKDWVLCVALSQTSCYKASHELSPVTRLMSTFKGSA